MRPLYLLALSVVATLSFAACADDSSSERTAVSSKPKNADDIQEEEENKPPFVGMTKAQALARYGEPRTQSVTDEGETWIYVRGVGTAIAKAAIPFYFGGRDIKTGALIFGSNGRVKKYHWDVKTDN